MPRQHPTREYWRGDKGGGRLNLVEVDAIFLVAELDATVGLVLARAEVLTRATRQSLLRQSVREWMAGMLEFFKHPEKRMSESYYKGSFKLSIEVSFFKVLCVNTCEYLV